MIMDIILSSSRESKIKILELELISNAQKVYGSSVPKPISVIRYFLQDIMDFHILSGSCAQALQGTQEERREKGKL